MNARPALVLAAVCLLVASACAASVTIAIPQDAKGAPGSDATVPIHIRGAQGLGSLQLELTYDPAVLEPKEVVSGPGIPGVLLEYNVTAPGRLRVAVAGNEPINGDGELTTTFAVKSAGNCVLGIENARAWEQANGHDMLVKVESGRFAAEQAAGTAAGGGKLLWVAVGAGVVLLVIVLVLVGRGRRGRS
jgi:hypothetical protein